MFERIVNLCPQTHRSPHRLSEVPEGPQPSSVARRCPPLSYTHAQVKGTWGSKAGNSMGHVVAFVAFAQARAPSK